MEEKEYKEGIQIDLKRVLFALLHNAWIAIIVAVVFGMIAAGYAWFFISPTYSASTQLYVNNNYVDSPGFSSAQLGAAKDLAETYMVILESRNVLDVVAEKTQLGYSYGQLKSMISASSVNETEVFEVRVVSGNYKHAAIIANAIADVLPEKITAVVEGSSVRVVDYAVENPSPMGPSYRKYFLTGLLVGAMLSFGIIVVVDVADTTISTVDYLSQAYSKIPLLAVIPGAESSKGGYYKGYYKGYYEMEKKRSAPNEQGGAQE